ncbi:extracellular solute-binding protein [Antarcticirhabdus aurantiaca]|uniref:Extracellular solute-binding protein n=1 Tax=Antarcticirhabdus aurantiaca TaxID=2606717 RepID=A0ACD4NPN9_9HYPH|nr:extracellular solute-binding protein [Antarcticirhabdus aurantiaca]WAJ28869.1 extracellular solute-binding protein [Jeongeuplla avenae]
MNDYEVLRVIEFLEQTREPFRKGMPAVDDEPIWNITTFLIKSEIRGQVVTVSTLASVTGIPYATSMRLISKLVETGTIVRVPRGKGGKSHALQPGPAMRDAFRSYARGIKALLARTVGLRGLGEDEEQYYFGGTPLGAQPLPPVRLIERRASESLGIRFLLNDDNYFSSMRNMWVDLRSNLASGRDFSLRRLPDLYAEVLANAERPVSEYDVITVNMPWLGELAERGLLKPLDGLVASDVLDVSDFHPVIRSTAEWRQRIYGIPIYCTIGILAARKDLFEDRNIGFPKTFDDVIEAGKRFHQPDQGMFGAVWDGALGMPIASSFLFFLGACGTPPISLNPGPYGFTSEGMDLAQLVPLIDSDAGRATLDFMQRLLDISPPNALGLAWDQNLALFLSGNAAMAYCWTMRASRMEYDIQSVVKRKVEYLPQPAGPSGGRASPIGGFVFAIPANLPEERVEIAAEAIAWMTSKDSMRAHVRNGFPIAPRFSTSADPEAAAGSPIVRFVDSLAKRNLLTTWQRPNIPAYTQMERVLSAEVHAALSGSKSHQAALSAANAAIERILAASPSPKDRRQEGLDGGGALRSPTCPLSADVS